MLDIIQTTQFKKDYKKLMKQEKDVNLLKPVISTLQLQKPLDKKYKDHPLHHNWAGFRECHIEGDWVLIYKANDQELTLILSRTGNHRDTLNIE